MNLEWQTYVCPNNSGRCRARKKIIRMLQFFILQTHCHNERIKIKLTLYWWKMRGRILIDCKSLENMSVFFLGTYNKILWKRMALKFLFYRKSIIFPRVCLSISSDIMCVLLNFNAINYDLHFNISKIFRIQRFIKFYSHFR